MRKRAFLAGMVGILLQAGLFREMSAFAGSSGLLLTMLLFGWLLFAAIGSRYSWRMPDSPFLLGLLGLFYLPVARFFGYLVFGQVGDIVPLWGIALFFMLVLLPPAFITGRSFRLLARESDEPRTIYGMEGLGAFFGGLLSLVAVGKVSLIFPLMAVGLVLAMLRARGFRWLLLPLGLLVGLLVLAFPLGRMERDYFRGSEVLARRQLHTGRAYVTGDGSERYLYVNSELYGTSGDSLSAQLWAYPALSTIEDGGDVLIKGGGLSGVIKEALRSGDNRVVYHLPDRGLIRLMEQYFSMPEDSRLKLTHRQPKGVFDLIILTPSFPTDIHSAMAYSKAALGRISKILTEDGVLAVYLNVGQNNLTPGEFFFTSSLEKTMQAMFPNTETLYLDGVVLIAGSESPIDLRESLRNMDFPPGLYYSREDMLGQMNPVRQDFFTKDLKRLGNGRIIEGSMGYVMAMARFLRLSGIAIPPTNLGDYSRYIMLFAVTILGLMALWTLFSLRRFSIRIAFITGFWAMGMEILLLLLFQRSFGSLYYAFGLLSGLFMLGSSIAALYRERFGLFRKSIFLMLLTSGLAVIIIMRPEWGLLSGLLLLVAGVATGAVFAGLLAEGRSSPGSIYSTDLLGGILGALVFGVMPGVGLYQSIAVLIFAAVLCLVWKS